MEIKKNVGLGLVKKDIPDITIEDLKKRFPSKKNTITQKMVDIINEVQHNPEFNGANLLDTMVTYQNVMEKNSGSMMQYLDAVKFCAYLESCGDNFTEAYKRAFSHRDFVINRMNAPTDSNEYKELTSAAARYRRTPMVKDILTQSYLPLSLMFMGGRIKAASILLNEAENADYAKDRIAAADKFLQHTTPNEDTKTELNIKAEDSFRDVFMSQMAAVVAKQRLELERGKSIEDAQVIDIDFEKGSNE